MYFFVVFPPPLYLKMWLKNLSFFSLHCRFKWLRTGASHASQGCYYLPVTFFVNGSSQLTMNLIKKNVVVKVSVDLHQLMVLWHLADKVQPWVHFSLVPLV